jgi:hypothetical protein
VDFFEALVFHVPEAVALVPAVGEGVDGDLAAVGEGQALRSKICLIFNSFNSCVFVKINFLVKL